MRNCLLFLFALPLVGCGGQVANEHGAADQIDGGDARVEFDPTELPAHPRTLEEIRTAMTGTWVGKVTSLVNIPCPDRVRIEFRSDGLIGSTCLVAPATPVPMECRGLFAVPDGVAAEKTYSIDRATVGGEGVGSARYHGVDATVTMKLHRIRISSDARTMDFALIVSQYPSRPDFTFEFHYWLTREGT